MLSGCLSVSICCLSVLAISYQRHVQICVANLFICCARPRAVLICQTYLWQVWYVSLPRSRGADEPSGRAHAQPNAPVVIIRRRLDDVAFVASRRRLSHVYRRESNEIAVSATCIFAPSERTACCRARGSNKIIGYRPLVASRRRQECT